jgi:hypothetical protein
VCPGVVILISSLRSPAQIIFKFVVVIQRSGCRVDCATAACAERGPFLDFRGRPLLQEPVVVYPPRRYTLSRPAKRYGILLIMQMIARSYDSVVAVSTISRGAFATPAQGKAGP